MLTVDEDGDLIFWDSGGRGERLFKYSEFDVVAVAADCKHILCTTDDEGTWVQALECDPSRIIKGLQQATPLCISREEREQYLREPHDVALHNDKTSQAKVRR